MSLNEWFEHDLSPTEAEVTEARRYAAAFNYNFAGDMLEKAPPESWPTICARGPRACSLHSTLYAYRHFVEAPQVERQLLASLSKRHIEELKRDLAKQRSFLAAEFLSRSCFAAYIVMTAATIGRFDIVDDAIHLVLNYLETPTGSLIEVDMFRVFGDSEVNRAPPVQPQRPPSRFFLAVPVIYAVAAYV